MTEYHDTKGPTMPAAPAPEPVVRPFGAWLIEQRAGALHAEISEKLVELVSAVTTTGKAGSLALTLNVKPVGKGDVHTVTVADRVAVKAPVGERGEALYFVDLDHNLVRNNPVQPELGELREVARPINTTDLKETSAR